MIYLLTYVNPDTDGVCSSIAYAEYRKTVFGEDCCPLFWGKINDETRLVLSHFGIPTPEIAVVLPPTGSIVLIDTHHLRQLPADLCPDRVIRVIDHHPAGDVEAFRGAAIQNENVGAVATLIAEMMQQCKTQPDLPIAGLMAAAIVSNTLNFSAPSTTLRDKVAFGWLTQIARVDADLVDRMFATRRVLQDLDTYSLLRSDYKEFAIGGWRIGIAQIEAFSGLPILSRADLLAHLSKLKQEQNVDYIFANVIDLSAFSSTLVAQDDRMINILGNAFGTKFVEGQALVPRILLRKADLIPLLQEQLTR